MARSYRFGAVEVRPSERQLLVEGKPAAVGARAVDVLLALIDHRDRVVSKNELLDIVWPGLVVEENNLQVQVSTLRKLLGVLRERAPASLAICALLDKVAMHEPMPEVRFVGFEAPTAFLVGYGLDHAEDFRHLPFIADLM